MEEVELHDLPPVDIEEGIPADREDQNERIVGQPSPRLPKIKGNRHIKQDRILTIIVLSVISVFLIIYALCIVYGSIYVNKDCNNGVNNTTVATIVFGVFGTLVTFDLFIEFLRFYKMEVVWGNYIDKSGRTSIKLLMSLFVVLQIFILIVDPIFIHQHPLSKSTCGLAMNLIPIVRISAAAAVVIGCILTYVLRRVFG